MMKTIIVELTDDQYTRFKQALVARTVGMDEATDENLAAYLKERARALTYEAEMTPANQMEWEF